MRYSALALLIGLFASSAQAGETAWQEVAPGVKLRLISTGQIKTDGTTLMGVEVDMPQTSKTYWRVPGDTGMPTELDFAGSTAIAEHRLLWPYPTRQETADYLDYVYLGPTVLPVEVTTENAAPVAQVQVTMGVCSEICVPAQASFSLPLVDSKPDRPNGLRLRQAVAMTPMDWQGDPDAIGDVGLQADADMLEVELDEQSDIDPATLIAATDVGSPLFGTPQKSPEPNLFLIPVLGKADSADLEDQSVQLTFMTDGGAFEVWRTIDASPEE